MKYKVHSVKDKIITDPSGKIGINKRRVG